MPSGKSAALFKMLMEAPVSKMTAVSPDAKLIEESSASHRTLAETESRSTLAPAIHAYFFSLSKTARSRRSITLGSSISGGGVSLEVGNSLKGISLEQSHRYVILLEQLNTTHLQLYWVKNTDRPMFPACDGVLRVLRKCL